MWIGGRGGRVGVEGGRGGGVPLSTPLSEWICSSKCPQHTRMDADECINH